MFKIIEIATLETFSVRHPVLRFEKPIESCHFVGDDLQTTKHFGLFYNNQLSGVISVFEAQNNLFENTNQFQIRGMAVLVCFQKKGFGVALLKHCENYILNKKGCVIWFNARETAIGFYEKSGYKIIGDKFEIEGIGTHFVLFKILDCQT
jgi:ribosomal protein S18 acetylase RimI-like enzyme